MRKIIFLLAILFTVQFCVAYKQPSDPVLIFYLPTIQSDDALKQIEDILVRDYNEKTVGVSREFSKKRITITPNERFNSIEILQLFRSFGYESYYFENGLVHRLTERGSELIIQKPMEH